MTFLVESLQNILRARLSVVALPNVPPKIDEAYREVKKKLGEGTPINLLTVQESEYWVRLARTTAFKGTWNDLDSRSLKNISVCLWHGETPLAADEALLSAFLNRCESRIKKSLCRALIWVYLYNYAPNKIGVSLLGKWLSKNVGQWDWSWSDRQKEFSLFDGPIAARTIGNIMMVKREKIANIFEAFGLSGNLQFGGMSSAVFSEMLKLYKENSKLNDTGENLSRLNRILEIASSSGQGFSYPKLKTAFIEGLLLPWTAGNPDEKIINLTQSFLLDSFGDPRLGGASWLGVDESAMRVIRGWLVKLSLAQFLDVVDELALDHQWKYRRAFWMAYYNKGVISEAWVAFATKGKEKVTQISKRYDDKTWLSCGNLYPYRDVYHAALILKIGDLTIVDFSHNGKWRIWKRINPSNPLLYNQDYDCDEIMYGGADYEGSHHGSDRYKWQNEVENIISKEIGRNSISRKDYTPR